MDHHEVNTAASFVSSLLKMNGGLKEHQLQVFQECLQESMSAHYKHHWYPDRPLKGSAYRCIRINNRVAMDPLIAKAANQCGLTIKWLFGLLPLELTLWVDPFHVCYRIGEDGSYCALYEAEATSSLAASPVLLADLPCKATSPILSPVEVPSRHVASPVPLADLPYNKNHFQMSGPIRPPMSNGQMYYVPCYQIPVYYRPSRPCYQIPVYYRPSRHSYQISMYYQPYQISMYYQPYQISM